MSIQIDIDRAPLSRAEKLLAGIEGGVEKAVKSAMHRAVSRLRTESGKVIREKYDISQSALRTEQNINVRYSYKSGSGITASVNFHGYKIPLYRYGGASPKKPTQDTGRLVSAMIQGHWARVHPGVAAYGHQLKGTSPTRFENAFVAEMSSGHRGIFERTGGVSASGNDAIREIFGSSIPQMLGSEDVQNKLAEKTRENFEDSMDHEITRILNGWR